MKNGVKKCQMEMAKGVRRREQILNSAIQTLAKEGVGGISYENLAQKLKLERAHVKYYFTSKIELLSACFTKIAQTAQGITVATLKDRPTWQSRLHGVADAAFEWARSHPDHLPILLLYYHYCAVDPRLSRSHRQVREEGRTRIEQIILASNPPGISKERALQIALELQIFLTGQIMEVASTGRMTDLPYFHRLATLKVEQFLAEIQNSSKPTHSRSPAKPS